MRSDGQDIDTIAPIFSYGWIKVNFEFLGARRKREKFFLRAGSRNFFPLHESNVDDYFEC